MKYISILLFFFTFNAFSETYLCTTTKLGAGYKILVEIRFNQPMAPYKVFQWNTIPVSRGEKKILEGRGDLTILQKIPRAGARGPQEDYTKWIISSPDLSLNFIHYGMAHSFAKIGTVGSGLPGQFSLNKKNIMGDVNCVKKQ